MTFVNNDVVGVYHSYCHWSNAHFFGSANERPTTWTKISFIVQFVGVLLTPLILYLFDTIILRVQ